MSQDDRVELIRGGFEAWESGDVEATLALYDPEIEVYAPPEIGNAGTYHGIDGFLEWTRAWLEAWETFRAGAGGRSSRSARRHALARVNQTGEGKGSGIQVERAATYIYDIRDGKLVFMALFFDHEQRRRASRASARPPTRLPPRWR